MSGSSRHLSRRAVVQALYQWEMTQQSRLEIEKYFLSDDSLKKSDTEYFHELTLNDDIGDIFLKI